MRLQTTSHRVQHSLGCRGLQSANLFSVKREPYLPEGLAKSRPEGLATESRASRFAHPNTQPTELPPTAFSGAKVRLRHRFVGQFKFQKGHANTGTHCV